MKHAEIAVVPSQWEETFGRTALEAMAGGAALIATPYGGLAEIIGKAALCVDSHKASDFASAIVRLAQSKEFRRKIQVNCRARAEKNFEIRKLVQRLDKVRAKLLKKGS